MTSYSDLSAPDAVARARADLPAHGSRALRALDRQLRWHALRWLLDRKGDNDALQDALVDAIRLADPSEHESWATTWTALLTLLRDASRAPSRLADQALLSDPKSRSADVLRHLASNEKPLRPKALADSLYMSRQHVSNLCKRLDERGLIVRRREPGGRATWLTLTARGRDAAAALPAPNTGTVVGPTLSHIAAKEEGLAKRLVLWNVEALAEPVPQIADARP